MNPFTGLAAVVVAEEEVVPSVVAEEEVAPVRRLEGEAVEEAVPVHRSEEEEVEVEVEVEPVLVPDLAVVEETSVEVWAAVWGGVAPRCHRRVQTRAVRLASAEEAEVVRRLAWEA